MNTGGGGVNADGQKSQNQIQWKLISGSSGGQAMATDDFFRARLGPLGTELPVDPSSGHGALGSGTVVRTALPQRTPCSPSWAHQPLDRAARHSHPLAIELAPDLVGAVDLHVGLQTRWT